jgi:hypothetical protein
MPIWHCWRNWGFRRSDSVPEPRISFAARPLASQGSRGVNTPLLSGHHPFWGEIAFFLYSQQVGSTLNPFGDLRERARAMTLEELRLARLVQAILVRNYVDTQRLDVEVVGTSVYIEGEFHVFEYHPSHQNPDRIQRELGMKRLLLQIEHEVRRIGEVTHLEMKFRNWNRVGLQWVGRSGSGSM